MIKKNIVIITIVFYLALILSITVISTETFLRIAAIIMLPGEWAVYTWAPMHDFWPFVAANVVNIIFYYFVAYLACYLSIGMRRLFLGAPREEALGTMPAREELDAPE